MGLVLNRPICFFDLETTGIQVATDRIVEISILKVWPNGNKESVTWRVNPEQPIPSQATEIHGIDDAMVAQEPNFKSLAPKVVKMIKDSDLAGFNSNRFDIPLLAEVQSFLTMFHGKSLTDYHQYHKINLLLLNLLY